jgi:acetyl-CoA carboxylase carboxyl transferase subunit alpha
VQVVATTKATAKREAAAFAAVELARNPDRPRTLHIISQLFTDWTEMHGDRLFGDDQAVVGGPALLGNQWVMVIGQEKGVDSATRAKHNFGMPHPEGYRKAQRLMKTAEKFGMPVICFVDTPAAHAGVGAEERGQAWAISESLLTMLRLRVPTISVVLSEGGSGGALALALGDRVLALENAVYCVAPPETAAAILYRNAQEKGRAAAAQKPWVSTAYDLGIVDELIPEPMPGAHAHRDVVIAAIGGAIQRHLKELCSLDVATLLEQRHQRYRHITDTATA